MNKEYKNLLIIILLPVLGAIIFVIIELLPKSKFEMCEKIVDVRATMEIRRLSAKNYILKEKMYQLLSQRKAKVAKCMLKKEKEVLENYKIVSKRSIFRFRN